METKQVEQSQSHMCKLVSETRREIPLSSRRLLFTKEQTVPSVKLRILMCEAASAGSPCHHSSQAQGVAASLQWNKPWYSQIQASCRLYCLGEHVWLIFCSL